MASTISSNPQGASQQGGSTGQTVRDEIAQGKDEVVSRARETGERVKDQAQEMGDNIARGASDIAENVNQRLRAVGVDTDRMVETAKEQVTDLQQLIIDEVHERPLRALGIAAAIGLFVGFMSAR